MENKSQQKLINDLRYSLEEEKKNTKFYKNLVYDLTAEKDRLLNILCEIESVSVKPKPIKITMILS